MHSLQVYLLQLKATIFYVIWLKKSLPFSLTNESKSNRIRIFPDPQKIRKSYESFPTAHSTRPIYAHKWNQHPPFSKPNMAGVGVGMGMVGSRVIAIHHRHHRTLIPTPQFNLHFNLPSIHSHRPSIMSATAATPSTAVNNPVLQQNTASTDSTSGN